MHSLFLLFLSWVFACVNGQSAVEAGVVAVLEDGGVAAELKSALQLASERQKMIDTLTILKAELSIKLGEAETKLAAILKEHTAKAKAFDSLSAQCKDVEVLKTSLKTSEESVKNQAQKHASELGTCSEGRKVAESKLSEEKVRYAGCQREWVTLQKTTEELRTSVTSIAREQQANARELKQAREKLLRAETDLTQANKEASEIISRSQVVRKAKSLGLVVKALAVNLLRNIRSIIGEESSSKITNIVSEYWNTARTHSSHYGGMVKSAYFSAVHPVLMPVVDLAAGTISPYWNQGSEWVERRLERTVNQLSLIEPGVQTAIPTKLGDRLMFVGFMVCASAISNSLVTWVLGLLSCRSCNKAKKQAATTGPASSASTVTAKKTTSGRSQSPAAPTIVKANPKRA